jgi:hypothetical protein
MPIQAFDPIRPSFPDAPALRTDVHPMLDQATGKMKVRRLADGAVFERWPVDAKHMTECGGWELVDPAVPTTHARLVALGEDVRALAKRVGASPLGTTDVIVRQLSQHVEAGSLTLPPEFHEDPAVELPPAA